MHNTQQQRSHFLTNEGQRQVPVFSTAVITISIDFQWHRSGCFVWVALGKCEVLCSTRSQVVKHMSFQFCLWLKNIETFHYDHTNCWLVVVTTECCWTALLSRSCWEPAHCAINLRVVVVVLAVTLQEQHIWARCISTQKRNTVLHVLYTWMTQLTDSGRLKLWGQPHHIPKHERDWLSGYLRVSSHKIT